MLTSLVLANQRQANPKDPQTVHVNPTAATNIREHEALAHLLFNPLEDAGSTVAALPCQVKG